MWISSPKGIFNLSMMKQITVAPHWVGRQQVSCVYGDDIVMFAGTAEECDDFYRLVVQAIRAYWPDAQVLMTRPARRGQ